MAGVFISYRREDAAGWAGRLQNDLRHAMPANEVFYDIGSIEIGEDFVDVMRRALEWCAVVVVLIGPQWLKAKDEGGHRRLDDPEDWVRLEVVESLQRQGLRVVPLLVGGASMPRAADLPDPLKPLARRYAHEITDKRWDYDFTQLVQALGQITALAEAPPSAPPQSGVPASGDGLTARVPAHSARMEERLVARKAVAESDAKARFQARLRKYATDPKARVAAIEAYVKEEGDPRFRPDAWYLPDDPMLGFIEIPAGAFTMGSDKKRDEEANNDELPPHPVTLPTFFIARFPVTVAQLRAYVADGGITPGDPDSLRGVVNHPVVLVSCHEALAYCDWLTLKLGEWAWTPDALARVLRPTRKSNKPWRVTLASEAEWEKAARGTDGRIYPWEGPADPNQANYADTGIGRPSAVGCFPGGASPYGVEELCGNVWEWTRSLWGDDWQNPTFKYPYEPSNAREDVTAGDGIRRVLRGGSFGDGGGSVRAAGRGRRGPYNRHSLFGFRVVVSPFSSGL